MIGLGCTTFLIAAILLAMDLKFGWSRKKGGGRLKPIINAIQSLTVLIMFPSKVRKEKKKAAGLRRMLCDLCVCKRREDVSS